MSSASCTIKIAERARSVERECREVKKTIVLRKEYQRAGCSLLSYPVQNK
jgi:hypothetical protein